jgi:alkylhydroperoxidase family enzyme
VGVTEEQIRALTFYERSPLFDDREKAVILYADRLTRGAAAVRDGTLQELRQHFSEDQIVELTLVICAANFTNRFNDGLRVEPDLG